MYLASAGLTLNPKTPKGLRLWSLGLRPRHRETQKLKPLNPKAVDDAAAMFSAENFERQGLIRGSAVQGLFLDFGFRV